MLRELHLLAGPSISDVKQPLDDLVQKPVLLHSACSTLAHEREHSAAAQRIHLQRCAPCCPMPSKAVATSVYFDISQVENTVLTGVLVQHRNNRTSAPAGKLSHFCCIRRGAAGRVTQLSSIADC